MVPRDALECAVDWLYKAEGSANVAWQYTGSCPALATSILRLTKATRRGLSLGGIGADRLLPEDPLEHASAVMRPLLGAPYVIPGARVQVSATFMAAMQARLACLPASVRPERRRLDRLDDALESIVLMLDHSLLHPSAPAPPLRSRRPVTFCVELKPKSGVARSGPAAEPCRYCAHQALKACEAAHVSPATLRGCTDSAHSSVAAVAAVAQLASRYCPLDLYSGDAARVRVACGRLVESPQNNLRVFVDGRLAFSSEVLAGLRLGGGGGAADGDGCAGSEAPLNVLEAVLREYAPFNALPPPCAPRPPHHAEELPARSELHAPPAVAALCDALSAVLVAEAALLGRLRDVQAADGGGLAAVWPLFQRLIKGAMSAGGESPAWQEADEAPSHAAMAAAEAALVGAARRGDDAEAVAAAASLRSFLVSTCAKDCSVLVAMQLGPEEEDEEEEPSADSAPPSKDAPAPTTDSGGMRGRVAVPWPSSSSPSHLAAHYSVAVVDLDPKPLGRLPHWVAQDAEIRAAWADAGPAIWRALGREGDCCRM